MDPTEGCRGKGGAYVIRPPENSKGGYFYDGRAKEAGGYIQSKVVQISKSE